MIDVDMGNIKAKREFLSFCISGVVLLIFLLLMLFKVLDLILGVVMFFVIAFAIYYFIVPKILIPIPQEKA